MEKKFYSEFDSDELKDLVQYCGGDSKKVIKWWNEKYSAPKNLEELFNYSKGKEIEWCSFPDEFDKWENCMYTYEKGLKTSLDASIQMFTEYYLDEDEIKEVWNEKNETYIFDKLEEKMEEYFPGIVKYLVNNKVSEIIFTW